MLVSEEPENNQDHDQEQGHSLTFHHGGQIFWLSFWNKDIKTDPDAEFMSVFGETSPKTVGLPSLSANTHKPDSKSSQTWVRPAQVCTTFQGPPWNIMLQNTIYLIENDTDSAIRGFQQVCQPEALSFCIKRTQGVLEHGGCTPKEAADKEPFLWSTEKLEPHSCRVTCSSGWLRRQPSIPAFFVERSSPGFVTLLCDSGAISKNLRLMSSEPFPVNSRPGVTRRRSLSATVIAFPGNRRPGKKRVLPGYMSRTTATQTQLCCFLINGLVTGLIMLLA